MESERRWKKGRKRERMLPIRGKVGTQQKTEANIEFKLRRVISKPATMPGKKA